MSTHFTTIDGIEVYINEEGKRLAKPVPARGALCLWHWQPPEDLHYESNT